MRLPLLLCLGALPCLAATTVATPDAPDTSLVPDTTTPSAIIDQAKAAYAALQSYGDSGKIESKLGGFTGDMDFTIQMQRPGLYRVTWKASGADASAADGGTAWSDGSGDFLALAGTGDEKEKDRKTALAGATGVSFGAAANLPGTFFADDWGNQLAGDFKRQKDDAVDGTDCYVVSTDMKNGASSISTTLWIAKQDHLIRQIKTVTKGTPKGGEGAPQVDDATLKKILESQNHAATPEAVAALRKQLNAAVEVAKQTPKPDTVETVETHANIVTNKVYAVGDFKSAGN
jgi:outer membrane lipoprotein-sorting protein